jgi:hypothetical protein
MARTETTLASGSLDPALRTVEALGQAGLLIASGHVWLILGQPFRVGQIRVVKVRAV